MPIVVLLHLVPHRYSTTSLWLASFSSPHCLIGPLKSWDISKPMHGALSASSFPTTQPSANNASSNYRLARGRGLHSGLKWNPTLYFICIICSFQCTRGPCLKQYFGGFSLTLLKAKWVKLWKDLSFEWNSIPFNWDVFLCLKKSACPVFGLSVVCTGSHSSDLWMAGWDLNNPLKKHQQGYQTLFTHWAKEQHCIHSSYIVYYDEPF